jgi:ATP synthase F1 complex assembly factor 2
MLGSCYLRYELKLCSYMSSKHVITPCSLTPTSLELTLVNHCVTTTPSMKPILQLHALDTSLAVRTRPYKFISPFCSRCLHTTEVKSATVVPITASGPPPDAPIASAQHVDSRVARRQKQAELLKRGQDLRSIAAGSGGGTAKLKRFWRDVHVQHADG